VMRPRSSSRGRNTSASVTVTVTVTETLYHVQTETRSILVWKIIQPMVVLAVDST